MNKKIIASVLAVTFALSVIAVPVSGATVEELQEQINQLTALINSLQAQLAGQTSTPATGAVCFYTDLEHGMTSAEVLKLQQTLNLDPATRVAASGAGAPGSETTYFGSLTLAAVKAFQAKHGIIT
ncbi:MAG: peptidoglycan-binding domain-containing protein, partial [Candidatus Paceibacterota bacterium]